MDHGGTWRLRMAKFNQKHLKRLRTLSPEEAWNQIVRDATVGTRVHPETFLKNLSPLPNFKNRAEVRRWLDWVLAKIDVDMSFEEAKVLRTCCDTLAALFKTTDRRGIVSGSGYLPLPAWPAEKRVRLLLVRREIFNVQPRNIQWAKCGLWTGRWHTVACARLSQIQATSFVVLS